jgi:hypothetical protein
MERMAKVKSDASGVRVHATFLRREAMTDVSARINKSD